MLYNIIRPIIRLSLKVFFKKISVIGSENIPKDGPAIFVCNHPSAVMDPLVAAVTLRKKVYFLAGSEWFGIGLKARIFKNQLNMIPVHRPWLAKGQKVSNVDMFKDCYESLAKGNWIILFPEASSKTVSKIRELKTGAIRIKEGFEKYTNHSETVPIVPIGLSYSNPHKFQSRLFVKIGAPIQFSIPEREMDEKEKLRDMTNQMFAALKDTVIHIDNDENAPVVDKVTRLFIDTVRHNANVSSYNIEANFKFSQDIATAVDYFEKEDPESFVKLNSRIDNYLNSVKTCGISDDIVEPKIDKKPSGWEYVLLFVGAPFYVLSVVLYFIPYQLSKFLFITKLRPKIDEDYDSDGLNPSFAGSLIFFIGMIVFILWTLIVGIAVGVVFNHIFLTIVVIAIGHPLFNFSLYYSSAMLRVNNFLKNRRARKKQASQISQLKQVRGSIITDLREYQLRFNEIFQ